MRPNRLLEQLRSGATAVGLVNTYPASGIIEGMCPGWDFVWIDGQHGQISYDAALHAVQAAGAAGVETLLRVPGHEPGVLGQYADLAPSAVMVPMVNTPEQAEAVVAALRFPPLGERSYGGRRVVDLDGREFFRERELMLVAQIETPEGVANAEAIIRTPGVDALFFGADDMKCRMQLPMNTPLVDHPRLLEAMQQTARDAVDAGKCCGSVAPNPPTFRACREAGYRMLVVGGDIVFLRQGAAAAREMVQSLLSEAPPTRPIAEGGAIG
jgi:4-hydroxy-2-oxoheptanedioate aldolase